MYKSENFYENRIKMAFRELKEGSVA